MAFQLPTVTVADLRDFYANHFAHASAPEHILYGVAGDTTKDKYEEEENALGYYDDGTPRTLTDEQIAMFRHSEIQAIIRKRRQQRDNNNNGSEEGEAEESVAEQSASVDSPASQPTLKTCSQLGMVSSGRVEKLKSQQWTTSSPRTKARNKKNRNKYKAKKRDERLQREQARKTNRDADDDDESDEWDPWHQAKGPDVQEDDTVDLEY